MAKSAESIFNFTRFDGGYFTNLPDAEMQPNEMLRAENAEWDNGLRKRRGLQAHATATSGASISGAIRAYVAGAWRTIYAKDLGSSTILQHQASASASWLRITYPSATAFTLTAGRQTQFAVLGERVVGVDGVDQEFLVYETGGSVCADQIERYDTRIRNTDNWGAGQYEGSGSTTYTDDTTDAQDTGTDDFQTIGATASTGFFVVSDYTFNRIGIFGASANGASVSFTLQYFGYPSYGASATWNTISSGNIVQTTGFATAGTVYIEWNTPIVSDGNAAVAGMEKLPDMASYDSFMGGKYAVRLYTNAAATATLSADYLEVAHTQYLRELKLGDVADTVVEHKNHIFLGLGNWMRHSPANSLKDWRYDDYEYFQSGGTVQNMVSHQDALAIILEDKLYGYYGNSWSNFTLRELFDHGTVSKRGAAIVGQNLYYVGEDGIWQFDGKVGANVSKYLKDDINSWTLTDAAAVNYKGELWVTFPTNEVMLKADPDTFRTDVMGNAKLSFYKFTNFKVNGWLYEKGDSDTGNLMGWQNNSANSLVVRADNDTVDFITSTASIDFVYQSPYMGYGDEYRTKQYRRFKPILADMASAATATDTKCLYQFTFNNKNEYGITGANATVTVSACSTGVFEKDLTIPHTMDGKRMSIYLRHSGTAGAVLYGYSIGVRGREY